MSPRARNSLICALIVFALLAADLELGGPVTGMDPSISTWMHEHMHSAVTAILLMFTHMHSNVGLAIMSIALAIGLAVLRRPGWIAWMLLTVQGGQLLNAGMKQVFGRARPHWDHPLLTLTTASFPSGHAAGTTVFWGFVCVVAWMLPASGAVKRALGAWSSLMVLLTALSRVYLGAHYLSDVLAGIAEGVAWVSMCAMLFAARDQHSRRSDSVRASTSNGLSQ